MFYFETTFIIFREERRLRAAINFLFFLFFFYFLRKSSSCLRYVNNIEIEMIIKINFKKCLELNVDLINDLKGVLDLLKTKTYFS